MEVIMNNTLKKAALILTCTSLSFGSFYAGTTLGNSQISTKIESSAETENSTQTILQTSTTIQTSTQGQNQELSISEIAELASVSVVEITTEIVSNDYRMGQFIEEGAGSGVIISSDGYLVTNYHVIDGASKISVKLTSGDTYDASLIGSDAQSDLAVLKINATKLTPAVFGTSSTLKVGELAVAIGNPLGELGGTVTDGIISALDRDITIDGETMTLLQTNAAINPGNSGGGLFNSSGELIGIVNAKSSGSGIEGLGFAIPIDTAKTVIEELIEHGYVSGRPSLGITTVDITNTATAMRYRISQLGVYVAETTSSSFQVGDCILSIAGQAIESSTDIKNILNDYQVGDKISVQVMRNNQKTKISVTLEELK